MPPKVFKTAQEYFRHQEKINGGVGNGESFSVQPTIHDKLETEITESSDLLPKIKHISRKNEEGGKIITEIANPITSRTDTSDETTERQPKGAESSRDEKYKMITYHADVLIRWDLIDAMLEMGAKWVKLYKNMIKERIAKDRQIIALNGTSIAANPTDPNLLDMDKGWIQKVRENNPGNVINHVKEEYPGDPDTADDAEITIGETGDYKNLDEMIAEMKTLIPGHLRDNLVVLLDENILAKEEAKLYRENAGTPTEKIVLRQSLRTYGALETFAPNFFPAATCMITSLDNLAIYWLKGGWKRAFKEKHAKEGFVDWNRYKATPEVQNYDKIVIVENIKYV